jgi:hypothetical protein
MITTRYIKRRMSPFRRPRSCLRIAGILVLLAGALGAQVKRPEHKTARKPFEAQSSSSIKFGSKDGMETVEIQNVAYEVT